MPSDRDPYLLQSVRIWPYACAGGYRMLVLGDREKANGGGQCEPHRGGHDRGLHRASGEQKGKRMNATKGDYTEVNGLRMYYETRGTGRPLIVLHGAYMTVDAMSVLVPDLA